MGIILMMAGIFVLLSPEVVQNRQTEQTQRFIEKYEEKYGRNSENFLESAETESRGKEADPLYQEIVRYNQFIYEDFQSGFSDPGYFEQSPVNVDEFENGVFGYIEIPSLGQTFELFLGATTENMSNGAAVMGQSSLPVGGENTNSVIVGHRGYNRNKTFFKNIEDIKTGDLIYITNPWERLTYMAESIDIIEPDDVDAVRIQTGKDMVTLLTCHPYGSHGRYRYLVYCTRYDLENDDKDINNIVVSDDTVYVSSRSAIEAEDLFRKVCIGVVISISALLLMRWIWLQIKKKLMN